MLSLEEKENLVVPFNMKEIRIALFSMKGLKAPGPYGIQPLVFQREWDIVKSHIGKFVNIALEDGSFPEEFSKAYITLILKIDNPMTMADFQPISLLNTSYKILTKLIVNRLQPLLQENVAPFQNSFLPGRGTSDNIIVTQDVVHSLMKRKGRKGGVIFKIDLHKAYDSVSWDFLRKAGNGLASARGLIRDSNGCWVKGFTLNIGHTDSLSAELSGVRAGLMLAKSLRLSKVMVELDSAIVVQFLKEGISHSHPMSIIARDALALISEGWVTEIRHIYREGNRCADSLANLAQSCQ
ncbi:uncharacterized protein A4U43_C10F8860 [Asparagus officinalis]|uniref:Uncharacterized protein n=1 Tax=Asparagus officinalis TaxID=4686 RepID=A0A5P1E1G3_ASPOF|nr:uncharacterized protein A4U43_C10F8860 [Asparagus officinalis]